MKRIGTKTISHIHVHVTPHARKEIFEKKQNGSYELSVKEKAEGNAANARVLTLLALKLQVPKNKLRIRTGHRGRKKVIEMLE